MQYILSPLLYTLVLLVCVHSLAAQSVNHEWSKGIGGAGADQGYAVATEHPGYVYVAGSFSGTVDFDPGPGIVNLSSDGATDGFVLKLDTAGVLIWAKRIGGTLSQTVYSIVVDTVGRVYVTGSHVGTTDLDPGPGFNSVISNGSTDIFIVHLDSSGNYLWGKSIGGSGNDNGNAIVIDTLGCSYVVGTYANSVDFDPGPGQAILTFNGNTSTEVDIFFIKLDNNGSLIWAKGIGGGGFDTCRSIALDGQMNIFITGAFLGMVDFDPGPGVFMMTATANSGFNTFLVKFNSVGNFEWAKSIGGHNRGVSVATDNVGGVYLTGMVRGTVDFDPGPGSFLINGNGFNDDVFISKLDGAGNFHWAKRIGYTEDELVYSIKVDGYGDIYIGGSFASPEVDFDPGPNFYRVSNNMPGQVCFVVKLNTAGDFRWARTYGGGSNSLTTNVWCSIGLDGVSNVYLTGNFFGLSTPIDFDPGAATTVLNNAGGDDIYVLKWKQSNCGLPVYSTSFVNVCDSFVLNGMTYTQTGNFTSLFSNSLGCDSISNIVLSVNHSSASTLSIIACDSFGFNGIAHTADGVYLDTLLNIFGCDSVISLQLTLLHSSVDTFAYSVCDSFVLNGTAYYSTGFHSQNYSGINGCDSIIVLDLTILNSLDTINHSTCGEYIYNGNTYTTSGFYLHSFTSVNSCDSVVVVNLTINPVDVSVTSTGTALAANATGASYQWLDCNGFVPIPGETNQIFSFTQSGTYAVVVAQNGCTDTSVCLVVNDVNDLTNNNELKLYPNPSDGNLTVELASQVNDAVLQIIDIGGRSVLTIENINDEKIQLNLNSLPPSVYVIEIKDKDRVLRAKFSKL